MTFVLPKKDTGGMGADGAVQGMYTKYMGLRSMFLLRAREAATLTIPALVPPEGANSGTLYPTPYQALGARGVNNLASKLLLTLLPPNASCFRLSIDDFELAKLTKQKGMRGKIEEAFGQIERAVTGRIETSALRVKMFEGLKQLIVAGNVLCHLLPDGTMRVFPLSRYVVKRDPVGTVLEIIVKEDLAPVAIPADVRAACGIDDASEDAHPNVSLYTRVYREAGAPGFVIYQEMNGIRVPSSEGSYPLDECPWLALRFTSVENEDYGRGYVEEYMGDLKSLEGLSKAMLEASAAAARILFFLKPTATTNKKKLMSAPNGSVIDGNIDDVKILQLDKYADLRIAFDQAQELTKRLSFAFLLNSSVQRSGDRVTAEEIRYMAGELEDALGGIYSILSQEFQLPLIKVEMHQMAAAGKLPTLPKDLVKPMVTTGLEALGRGHDLNKLNTLIQQIVPLGPDVVQKYFNYDELIKRVGTSLGIDMQGLIRTPEEVAAKEQQDQAMQMAQSAAPHLAKAGAEAMTQPQQ